MVEIALENVTVEFASKGAGHASLRGNLLRPLGASQISRDQRGGLRVTALNSVSLHISSGERVALLGKNGAGKSSLLRVVGRIYPPVSGNAHIRGSIGALIDISLGMNPEATGRQNIFLRGALLGISKKVISERFDEVVEFSELGEFIHLPVRTYSSGMQLRLSFAVATLFSPDILVMDEWLSVGDEAFRQKAETRLKAIVDAARILVIASHSRELVEQVCNRGVLLDKGQIIADGPISEITRRYFG
jgi:lipopolysaccharide transport system ATP-binding protein